jgi:hypothetical protein
MSRLKKLENHYKEPLKEKNINDVSVFIQSILDADITKGKYARFLIDSFLNDKFLEEDLIGDLESTVGQAVSLFDKHKGKLPLKQRSVFALDKETKLPLYQSPGDLWNSVKQYQDEKSGKELKKEEQEQIYRETEFVYKDEKTGFQIISPLTEESAKWWGKGTRWCTSAENNNMFYDYASLSPLLILLLPSSLSAIHNGLKLQLWKSGNNIQFMDEADNNVSLDFMKQYWNILEPVCLWLNNLQFIPEEFRTKERCESAIKQNGYNIKYVPKELRTKELCESAIKQNGYALGNIPEELRTPKLCELAVKQNGDALLYISYELRTPELCKVAVQNYGYALNGVPKELRTKDMCELAVQQNGLALKYIPYELRTKELCELAVQQNGMALQFVSEEMRTKKICDIAIRQNIDAEQYVPEKHKVYTEIYKLKCEQNKKEILSINIEEYQKIFKELREIFPNNNLSLDIK